jgi:hypothetical protein
MEHSMNLKSILHHLPFVGDKSSILVCETDGFHLRGAVISRHAKQLKVDFSAQSDAIDYQDAVKDVVTRLREQGWQGREAVLLTPAVFSSVIELPIPANQPRSALQMQELIRWELEPLMIQHAATWSFGQLLLAKGYLTEAQVTEVLDSQKGKHKKGLGSGHGAIYSFKRYGDFAIELGYVNQAQVDECIARQAWLRADSEEYSCGWAVQSAKKLENVNNQAEAATSSWLVSGANTGLIRQWEAAFLAQKIVLSDVFPLVACTAELAPAQDEILLLESAYGFVAALRMHSGVVTAVDVQKRPMLAELDACLESYHHLITPEINQLWLSAPYDSLDLLTQQLSEMIGREVHVLPTNNAQISAGVFAVAGKLLKVSATSNIAGVSVRGPKPSLFKRVEVRAIAASLLLLLIIGMLEATLYVRKELAQSEHTKTLTAKKEFDALVAKAQAKVDAVNKLKEDIKNKTESLNNENVRFDFFSSELVIRTVFVQRLLDGLSNSVTEEVVINAINETPNFGIRVSAWALTEKAAQQFIQSYKNATAPLGMELQDPIVRSQTGRLGLFGYDIQFRLVSFNDAVANSTLTNIAKPSARKPKTK